jgi:hypothetical protein
VVSPSCTILSGKNMNVDVGTIKRSDLSGVGTTAGGKDFNIELQCSGGLSSPDMPISAPLSPERWRPARRSPGALLNEKDRQRDGQRDWDSGTEGGVPLEFNKKYSVGTLNNQETRYITLPCMRVFINMRRPPVPVKWSRT